MSWFEEKPEIAKKILDLLYQNRMIRNVLPG